MTRNHRYWAAKHDAEQEWIAEAERLAHDAGECRKGCAYCLDEKERGEESLGG